MTRHGDAIALARERLDLVEAIARDRDEIAGADRAMARHDGKDIPIEHLDQIISQGRARPGSAREQRVEAHGDAVVDVAPVGMVVQLLRLERHAAHEAHRLAKRAELEGLCQPIALEFPARQLRACARDLLVRQRLAHGVKMRGRRRSSNRAAIRAWRLSTPRRTA